MGERILAQHPDPDKQGVNIDKGKYDVIRDAILQAICKSGEITFQDLSHDVRQRVQDGFEGSVTWYVTTVKLDLKARGLIRRVPGSQPQRIHLADPRQES